MSSETAYNLALGTGAPVKGSSAYLVASYKLVTPMVPGRKYTITVDVGELSNDKTPSPRLEVFTGRGRVWHGSIFPASVPGEARLTFACAGDGTDDPDLMLFNYPNGGARSCSIAHVMLVEGTEPAAWAPAEGESLAGGGCSHER